MISPLLIVIALTAAPHSRLKESAQSKSEAASEGRSPRAAAAAPAVRVIGLDAKRAKAVYKVNAAPGLATVIELPEPWATTPTCGDCVFGDKKPDGQLWRLALSPSTRTISVRPTRLPGPDIPASAFVTDIDVTLDSGIAITLFVELSLPEEADARLEFTLPDAEKTDALVSKRESDLEAKFDERVRRAATDAVLSAAMRGSTCKDFSGSPHRHEDVVVRLRQMCRNSALVFVTFEVENRRHDALSLAGATLEGTNHAAGAAAKLEKTSLRFNERGLGIAALRAGLGTAPDRYTLTVTANGVDEDTNIIVDDIDF